MARVVTPIIAAVEFITGVKSGQYGDYRSVLFKDADGGKIWKSFPPDAEELDYLTKGTRVQLVPTTEKSGKVSHNIILLDEAASSPQSPALPPAAGWSADEKRALAAKVEQHSDLLAYCLQVSKVKFAETGLIESEESIRTLATTLFIQALRG